MAKLFYGIAPAGILIFVFVLVHFSFYELYNQGPIKAQFPSKGIGLDDDDDELYNPNSDQNNWNLVIELDLKSCLSYAWAIALLTEALYM